jgi:hypothetical protein
VWPQRLTAARWYTFVCPASLATSSRDSPSCARCCITAWLLSETHKAVANDGAAHDEAAQGGLVPSAHGSEDLNASVKRQCSTLVATAIRRAAESRETNWKTNKCSVSCDAVPKLRRSGTLSAHLVCEFENAMTWQAGATETMANPPRTAARVSRSTVFSFSAFLAMSKAVSPSCAPPIDRPDAHSHAYG